VDLSPTFVRELEGIVGARGIVSSPEGRLTYEADMHTFYKGQPDLVVLPETAEQTATIVRLCRREKVPVWRRCRRTPRPWVLPLPPRRRESTST